MALHLLLILILSTSLEVSRRKSRSRDTLRQWMASMREGGWRPQPHLASVPAPDLSTVPWQRAFHPPRTNRKGLHTYDGDDVGSIQPENKLLKREENSILSPLETHQGIGCHKTQRVKYSVLQMGTLLWSPPQCVRDEV